MEDKAILFCEGLARLFPAIGEILESHLIDNDELLPHVLIGDVSRYVLTDQADRREVVMHIEQCFDEGGDEVKDLIAVSFVENFPSSKEFEKVLDGVEANALRDEWRRQNAR